MGAARNGNLILTLLLLLLGGPLQGALGLRGGYLPLGRHMLADDPGYCAAAPYSALVTVGNDGTCGNAGSEGGCGTGGCWCSKNLDPNANPCEKLPQGSGPWQWCRVDAAPTGQCAPAGSCPLWYKEDPLGVVTFYAKEGCAQADVISSTVNSNYKFGLVVAHGGGGGCAYSQLTAGMEGMYAFDVGRNKEGQLQGLSNINVCYTQTPTQGCQCSSATDPSGWGNPEVNKPTYACPGAIFKYTGGGATFKDNCNNDVLVQYFTLKYKVTAAADTDWVRIGDGPIPSVALENPELYKACATYRLETTVCGTTFTRTILVREMDESSFNDPAISQADKAYCPGATINPADLFGDLTGKVLGSSNPEVMCTFSNPALSQPTYPETCGSTRISGTYSVCLATAPPVNPFANSGSTVNRVATVLTHDTLTPSTGWAAVTQDAPFGFVDYRCPVPGTMLGTLSLTSSCSGRTFAATVTTGGQIDTEGCGTLTGVSEELCGQKFGRKVVQDVESVDKPVVGATDTQCPGFQPPNDFLPLTTTATMAGAPPSAPKCTVQGSPLALPAAPSSCGSTPYTRTYSLCGKQVTSDPRLLVTDALMSDGGWSATTDYLCPYEPLNLAPVTLTSSCPGFTTIPGNPFKPVLDGPDLPWFGCGTVKYKVSFCGETFTKTFVRGGTATTTPSLHTVCPNAPPPSPLFIPGSTVITVPGSNPPKTCTVFPSPPFPHPEPRAACGPKTYRRRYNFCGGAVYEEATVTVDEGFTGFDPACPLKYTTSCPAPGTVKLASFVGKPQVGRDCTFTQAVKATVCGVDHVEKYRFSSCRVAHTK